MVTRVLRAKQLVSGSVAIVSFGGSGGCGGEAVAGGGGGSGGGGAFGGAAGSSYDLCEPCLDAIITGAQ